MDTRTWPHTHADMDTDATGHLTPERREAVDREHRAESETVTEGAEGDRLKLRGGRGSVC